MVRVENWQVENDVLILSLLTEKHKKAEVRFRAEQPGIWRITFFPPDVTSKHNEPVAAQPVLTPIPLQVDRTEKGLRATGPELALEVEFRPWLMRFLDAAGAEVWTENPSDVDGLGRPFVLPLGYVQKKGTPSVVTETFRLRPGERLFGLGEKFTPLEKTGQRIISWNEDALGSTSERSHKNIPFLWSTRGYGLFIDSSARITWDLGASSSQSATAEVEADVLDFYLIYGPAPARILEHYAGLTGRAPVPPKWSFGIWLSSAGTYRTQEEIERLVRGLERHEIPADVIHIDTWWLRDRKYCDFEWNRDAFPHPEELIDRIHARGLKLSLWEHPYVSTESDLFKVGKEKGYFVKRPDGEVYVIDYGLSRAPKPDGIVRLAGTADSWNARVAIVDFTNPAVIAWYKDLHRPLLRMGVDVFKTDFGEDIPADAVFHDGRTGATMHNLYPVLYNRAVFEVTQEEKGYGLVWGRSSFASSQKYPVVWSGDPASDFASLATTVRGGLAAGQSGLPFWSNDIGGYRGKPSAELFARWAQFGLFCSHSRLHGDSPREPWHFGEEAVAVFRKHANLRYELFPYIYSAAWEASLKGLPVIRALPLAFPKDRGACGQDFEFMFGTSILVAPVIQAGGRVNVYLPEGTWFDYWTSRAYEGPRHLSLEVPLDILPIFVREGAIIPRMSRQWRIPEEEIDPLIVEVWPRGSSSHLFYEDEGVTEFRSDQKRQTLELAWSGPTSRRLIFHLKRIPKPKKITLAADEERDKVLKLEGLVLKKTYVLALPETASGQLHFFFR